MTKLTKNEKILRKANEKWKNFLAEGAFKNQVDEDVLYFGDDAKDDDGNPIDLERAAPGTMWKGKPMQIDDNGQRYIVTDDGRRMYATISDEYDEYYEEGKVNEARMGEYGKIDAEDGNPPTKIGRGNEEYMAAYNAVLQARGEEPLDIQQPDQAYLDALQQGRMKPSDHSYNEENEKKSFEVGEFVYVVNGSLKGASGKILEPVTTSTGEEGFAIELYSDAKMKVFGKRGDEVIALPQDLESGGTTDGSELYDIDEKKNLKEEVTKRVNELLSEGLTPEQVKEKIIEEGLGDFIRKGADFVKAKTGLGMTTQSLKLLQQIKIHKDEYFAFRDKHYPDSSDVRNFIEFVEQNARKQAGGSGGMRRDSAYEAISREKFKTMEFPAGYTGKARKILSKISKLYYNAVTDGGANKDKTLRKKVGPAVKALDADLDKAKDYLKQLRVAVKQAQKSGNSDGLRDVYKDQVAHERYLEKTQAIADAEFAAKAKEAERKRKRDRKKDDDMEFTGGQMSTKSRYAEEKKSLKEEVIEDFAIELEGGLTFADVEEAGLVTPGVDSVIDNGDGYAQVYAEPEAMMKMAKTLEAMTGVMVSPKSHGAVDERSKDDERDLEEPVKYGSGAELEFDPKAQKFYDRKRDMYIDDPEEEDNLTREDRTTMSSDPELDQIEDIARDMLEAGIQNSRIPVGLMSVASALKAQGFDATVSSGVLNIDGKYFMGKKENFDISPDEDVRQVMGYVLGYMG